MVSDFGQKKPITCHNGNNTSCAIIVHGTFPQLGGDALLVRSTLCRGRFRSLDDSQTASLPDQR
jgi:hypothetical protein